MQGWLRRAFWLPDFWFMAFLLVTGLEGGREKRRVEGWGGTSAAAGYVRDVTDSLKTSLHENHLKCLLLWSNPPIKTVQFDVNMFVSTYSSLFSLCQVFTFFLYWLHPDLPIFAEIIGEIPDKCTYSLNPDIADNSWY